MDTIKPIDIIIARYKENIDWINEIKLYPYINNIYVYNKFYQEDYILSNVGREAHTYLYHITHNYDNLNTVNIFLQGNPLDHCPNLLDKIK